MQKNAAVVKPKNMRGTLVRLWRATRNNRGGILLSLALSALASLSAVLSPRLIGSAVTRLAGGDALSGVLWVLAAVYLGDWLFKLTQRYVIAGVSQKVVCRLRKDLFASMCALPLRFFDRHAHGELMSRLTNDVDNISATLSDSLTQLMTLGFTLAGILVSMLLLSVPLTLAMLLSVPLVVILVRLVTRRTRSLYRAQQAILGKLNAQVEEGVSGLSAVKAFGREKRMLEQFQRDSEALCQVGTQAQIWSGYLMPLMNVINNLCFAFLAVAGSLLAADSGMSVGVISSFLLYARQFVRPINEVATLYNTLQTAVAGAERVFQVMDEPPEEADRPGAAEADSPRGEVRFEHVTFGYDPEKPVLRDVSLTIPAGTRVAVVGPTGAGKTTIISLLTRFYDVDGGAILLDGRDLRDYQRASLRRAFGVVLQDASLFQDTVLDNIRYGRPDASREAVERAARDAGADGFIARLPQGYDTPLTGGGALSQGETQLMTIARSMLADSPIQILDEATSAVDTVTEARIRDAMLRMTSGRTSFMIAHRLSTIRDADVIVVIQDGKIAEAGSHGDLMAKKGLYRAMYEAQMGLGD